MTVLNTIRLVIFVTALCFSLIVLGILANFTNITSQNGFYYQAFALGIATSLMTFLLVGASLIIDRLRRGAITSLVMVELAWVGLLWVLWLATAASITDLGIFTSCGYFNSEVESTCHQYQAAQAFSFLNWLMLFGWWIALLAMSIRAASNGISGVWRTPVTEHPGWNKNATSPYGATTTYPTMPANNYGAPGQPQQPGYGMPPQQQTPYSPQQGYGTPPPQQQPYGTPQPQQQPYGTPQPQQGYGTPAPQQGYGTPQPQAMYGAPAPGSPYNAPQQMGQPGHPYPNYPQPQ
ncbi:hypothetical protein M407DRAFT_144298 [Tulasnella calospora MUT 4182]|uniref:Uncharacterized protein n=1 Tax=Tulasnella calospora MUT 4182 TaxID=1051891 RepID=A0A0C3QSI5_9AGAM|nr:hypothetical protein M407DRAFT_144298 [Tulasnella calospora MUT 4182]